MLPANRLTAFTPLKMLNRFIPKVELNRFYLSYQYFDITNMEVTMRCF